MSETEPLHVVIAMDFGDTEIDMLRQVSPRLRIEQHFPTVPDRAWATADILYTGSRLPTPDQAPHLRWIQLHTAGADHVISDPMINVPHVTVTTASGVHAVNVAEYCLGMMLSINYKIPEMLRAQAKSEWRKDRYKVFAPSVLRGATLGIIGYGAIGRELARVADTMGMKVLAMKRDVMHPADELAYAAPGTGDPLGEIPARIYPPSAIASMAAECDFLVLITPLTPNTRGLIDKTVLKSMKSSAVLINVARGGVVDEGALVEALENGRIRGAAMDVFAEEPLPPESPLWRLPSLIISPHIAGFREDYYQQVALMFSENLRRYLDGTPLFNQVNRQAGY